MRRYRYVNLARLCQFKSETVRAGVTLASISRYFGTMRCSATLDLIEECRNAVLLWTYWKKVMLQWKNVVLLLKECHVTLNPVRECCVTLTNEKMWC